MAVSMAVAIVIVSNSLWSDPFLCELIDEVHGSSGINIAAGKVRFQCLRKRLFKVEEFVVKTHSCKLKLEFTETFNVGFEGRRSLIACPAFVNNLLP